MALLRNSEFLFSPLSVELIITNLREEGWRGFRLALTTDAQRQCVLASCSGELSSKDYDRLMAGLGSLADGRVQSFEFGPTEPSFLLRAKCLPNGEIECLWVVDQGAVEHRYSTDTGSGVLMTVMPEQVAAFVAQLTQETETAASRR